MDRVVLRATLALFCLAAQGSGFTNDPIHWTYNYEHDVDHWIEVSENCGGSQQSPINIDPSKAVPEKFAPLFFSNYDVKAKKATLRNTGHTVTLSMEAERSPNVADGGLIGKYNFAQMHFHWGKESNRGSEHTIKSMKYAGEVHLVHYNTKYGNLTNAVIHPDGLVVVGFFLQSGASDNPAYKPLFDVVEKVTKFEEETTLEDTIIMKDMLPSNLNRFYRYPGSLTTPNCNEVVSWTVLDTPVVVSEKQLDKLRKLFDDEGHSLVDNYRPAQPLKGRTVYVRSGSAKVSSGALLLPTVAMAWFLGSNTPSGF